MFVELHMEIRTIKTSLFLSCKNHEKSQSNETRLIINWTVKTIFKWIKWLIVQYESKWVFHFHFIVIIVFVFEQKMLSFWFQNKNYFLFNQKDKIAENIVFKMKSKNEIW